MEEPICIDLGSSDSVDLMGSPFILSEQRCESDTDTLELPPSSKGKPKNIGGKENLDQSRHVTHLATGKETNKYTTKYERFNSEGDATKQCTTERKRKKEPTTTDGMAANLQNVVVGREKNSNRKKIKTAEASMLRENTSDVFCDNTADDDVNPTFRGKANDRDTSNNIAWDSTPESKCPLCGMDFGELPVDIRNQHAASCGDQADSVPYMPASSSCSQGGDDFVVSKKEPLLCPICLQDLSMLSDNRRILHSNRCLELSLREEEALRKYRQERISNVASASIKCHVCNEDITLLPISHRDMHIKSCEIQAPADKAPAPEKKWFDNSSSECELEIPDENDKSTEGPVDKAGFEVHTRQTGASMSQQRIKQQINLMFESSQENSQPLDIEENSNSNGILQNANNSKRKTEEDSEQLYFWKMSSLALSEKEKNPDLFSTEILRNYATEESTKLVIAPLADKQSLVWPTNTQIKNIIAKKAADAEVPVKATEIPSSNNELMEKLEKIELEFRTLCKEAKNKAEEEIKRIETEYYASLGRLSEWKERRIARAKTETTRRKVSEDIGLNIPHLASISSQRESRVVEPVKLSNLQHHAGAVFPTHCPDYAALSTECLTTQMESYGYLPAGRKVMIECLKKAWHSKHGTSATNEQGKKRNKDITERHTTADEKKSRVINELVKFIKSNTHLYQQILLYEPIQVKELHQTLRSAGIKCSLKLLTEFLTTEGVNVQRDSKWRNN